jgi:hypothetical protein
LLRWLSLRRLRPRDEEKLDFDARAMRTQRFSRKQKKILGRSHISPDA